MDAVVFDFDGLILDTETSVFTATATAYADHGLELRLDEWVEASLGRADRVHWTEDLATRLGRPLEDPEALVAARNLRHHEAVALEAVRPGVVELLDEASDAGVATAVASSSSRAWVAGHLDRLGLLDRFAAVRTSDDVGAGRTKPAPDLYLAACDALGADPASSVALEDSPNGIASARAAGLRVVGVAAGLTAGLPLDGADLVVPSLAEVRLATLSALLEERQ